MGKWNALPIWRRILYLLGALLLFYLALDFIIMPLYTRQWQSIEVPVVVGKTETEAQQILIQRGLVPMRGIEKFDETWEAGYVIFQSPGSDLPVKKGRRVYLTISKGQRFFPMPKLTGLSERDARFNIEESELALGSISYRTDSFLPDGVVCAQSVEPGTEVTIGTRINLTVSLGVEPSEFIVPDLIGKSQKEAEFLILRAGLVLGAITTQPTGELLPNTVVSQSLAAGTAVNKGDAVDLVVSVLPE